VGSRPARFGEPLGHELAGEVGRHPVLEDHRDHREAELRERAHLGGAGSAHERGLDRVGHALLDLDRGEAGGLGHDHDLVVGHVGEGLDRHLAPGHDPGDDARGEDEEDERPLAERRGDEPLDGAHLTPPRPSCP
jgi:hypothetical protein